MIIITHRPNSISNHHHPILSVGVRTHTHSPSKSTYRDSSSSTQTYHTPMLTANLVEGGTDMSWFHIISVGSCKVHRQGWNSYSFPAHSSLSFRLCIYVFLMVFGTPLHFAPSLSSPFFWCSSSFLHPCLSLLTLPLHPSFLNNRLEDSSFPSENKQVGNRIGVCLSQAGNKL